MASVTVHLHNEKPPRAIVMQGSEDRRRWICCYPDEGVSIYLHGYDIDAAMEARALAAQLTTAADEIEAAIQGEADAKVAAVAGVDPRD